MTGGNACCPHDVLYDVNTDVPVIMTSRRYVGSYLCVARCTAEFACSHVGTRNLHGIILVSSYATNDIVVLV